MPDNIWFIAAIWMAMAFIASLVSIWTGISVALVEIVVGIIAGNFSLSEDRKCMSASEIIVRVVANCLTMAIILTFMPAFEPRRKSLIGRFFYFFGRYATLPGILLAVFYWLAFRREPHE